MAGDGSGSQVRAPAASNTRGATFALLAFAVYSTHDVVVKLLGADYSPIQIVFFANLFGFPIVTLMLMRDRSDAYLQQLDVSFSEFTRDPRTADLRKTALAEIYRHRTKQYHLSLL